MEGFLMIMGGSVLIGALLLYGFIVNGFVLSVLWKWFIVPYFGLPPISIPLAIGLMILVSIPKGYSFATKKIEDKDLTKAIVGILISPWIALLCGWIVRLFL